MKKNNAEPTITKPINKKLYGIFYVDTSKDKFGVLRLYRNTLSPNKKSIESVKPYLSKLAKRQLYVKKVKLTLDPCI